MKQNSTSLFFLILASIACQAFAQTEQIGYSETIAYRSKIYRTSQTFMFPRPIYHTIGSISGRVMHFISRKPCGWGTSIRAVPIYQRSEPERGLPAYWLLSCKDKIVVAGDDSAQKLTRDVRAEWLDIRNTQKAVDHTVDGTFTVCPRERIGGVTIAINQDLKSWFDWKWLNAWWLDISIPIVSDERSLMPQSSDARIRNALNRIDLEYARFDTVAHSVVGAGEVRATVGRTLLDEKGVLISYQTGFATPGEERLEDPDYLFKPRTGSNGAWSILNTLIIQLPLGYCCDQSAFQLCAAIEHRFLSSTHQRRTLDLRDKQWSRYMLVRRKGEEQTIPLANVSTFSVEVKPHSFVNIAGTLCFHHVDAWSFEAGFEFWAHDSEQVKLRDNCCDNKSKPRIEFYGIAGSTVDCTASQSTIAELAADDTDSEGNKIFVPLHESDFDPMSASGRGGIGTRLNFALFADRTEDYGTLVGLGGYYEFPHTNTTLKNWGVWALLGYTW